MKSAQTYRAKWLMHSAKHHMFDILEIIYFISFDITCLGSTFYSIRMIRYKRINAVVTLSNYHQTTPTPPHPLSSLANTQPHTHKKTIRRVTAQHLLQFHVFVGVISFHNGYLIKLFTTITTYSNTLIWYPLINHRKHGTWHHLF